MDVNWETTRVFGKWEPRSPNVILVWPPLGKSRFFHRGSLCGCFPRWILIWTLPALLAAFGFLLQNFQLRIATYNYVHVMLQYDLHRPFNQSQNANVEDIPLTMGRTPLDPSFGSLHDPVTLALGPYMKLDTSFLDGLAALFPLLFAIFAIATDQPFVWVRVMLCFFVLAFGKGLFAQITIIPPSDGWQACKARLEHHYSIEWYAQVRSTWELFFMNPTSRVCADMMWSGHTYFVTLFAFGLFEVTRLSLRSTSARVRLAAEFLVAFVAILEQSVEVYCVLRSRFHYTADVVMAVFVTYILFTNGAIAILIMWSLYPSQEEIESLLQELVKDRSRIQSLTWFFAMSAEGRVNLGCCCCAGDTAYLYNQRQLETILAIVEANQDRSSQDKLDVDQRHLIAWTMGFVNDHRSVGPAVLAQCPRQSKTK